MATLFHWTNVFETGLDFVDQQHKYLVSLINDLGALVLNGTAIDQTTFVSYYRSLLDYTRFHFAEEVANMQEWKLDERHLNTHVKEHLRFVEELQDIDPNQEIPSEELQSLLTHLTNWLAYHILGIDQSMARQIDLIKEGMTPAEAYEEDAQVQATSSEPLLAALRVLYQTVLEKNQRLLSLNKELDKRVRQRTLELEAANLKLHQQTIIDELTGLYNRRFAVATLEKLWAARGRSGAGLAVLMLDVDKFKPVNDCFGHAAGDALLCQLALHFKHSVRSSDYVCRMGGDEFLIICPDTSMEGASQVAKKILFDQRAFYLDSGELCWQGGISIGIAEVTPEMASINSLLAVADNALYEIKRKGGNSFKSKKEEAPE